LLSIVATKLMWTDKTDSTGREVFDTCVRRSLLSFYFILVRTPNYILLWHCMNLLQYFLFEYVKRNQKLILLSTTVVSK